MSDGTMKVAVDMDAEPLKKLAGQVRQHEAAFAYALHQSHEIGHAIGTAVAQAIGAATGHQDPTLAEHIAADVAEVVKDYCQAFGRVGLYGEVREVESA